LTEFILVIYFYETKIIKVTRLSNQIFPIETQTIFTLGRPIAHKVTLDKGFNICWSPKS